MCGAVGGGALTAGTVTPCPACGGWGFALRSPTHRDQASAHLRNDDAVVAEAVKAVVSISIAIKIQVLA